MSSLRFINQYSWDTVQTINITDVFTEDFRVYKLQFSGNKGYGYGYIRFITSSGSVSEKDLYAWGSRNLLPTTESYNGDNNSTNGIRCLPETPTGTNGGDLADLWIFNPYQSDAVTGMTFEGTCNATQTANRGIYGTGMYRDRVSITGFQIRTVGTDIVGGVKIYGIRHEDI